MMQWPRHRQEIVAVGVSTLLLGLSVLLIVIHIRTAQAMQQDALPLAGQVSSLEHRRDVLRRQVDVTQLQTALTAGSIRERLAMYVLSDASSNDRLLSLFSLVSDALQKGGAEDYSAPIVLGKEEAATLHGETLLKQSVSFSVTVSQDGLDTWLSLIDLMGYVTVADALPTEDVQLLLSKTEQENPAALDALQQFLSLDLSMYASNPNDQRDRLLAAFATDDARASVQTALDVPLLQEAVRFFGTDLGKSVVDQKLWPMPLVTLQKMTVEPADKDMQKVTFVLEKQGRKTN